VLPWTLSRCASSITESLRSFVCFHYPVKPDDATLARVGDLLTQPVKDALISLISPAVAVALIAVIGAFATARAALADITLKRRLETAKRFTDLAEIANNLDGKRGLYEIIAAIALLGEFGRDEPHLRSAARAVLQQIQTRGTAQPGGAVKVSTAAGHALNRLPKHDKGLRLWRRR
jgi:hypothetical protein